MTKDRKYLKNGEMFYSIRSRYVFNKVMEDEERCLKFLRLIFPNLNITEVKINTEQVIENNLPSRSIRLDVYVEEKDLQHVLDVEMQVVGDSDVLPKRSRYYSSNIDIRLLKHGIDYSKLPETIVLFVCPFDLFGKGLPIYTFMNTCQEDTSLLLNDGQIKVFLNTTGAYESLSDEVKELFDYINTDEYSSSSSFAREVYDAVNLLNDDPMFKENVMTLEMDIASRELRAEERGEAKIKTETTDLIKSLQEQGLSSDEILAAIIEHNKQ